MISLEVKYKISYFGLKYKISYFGLLLISASLLLDLWMLGGKNQNQGYFAYCQKF